MIADVEDLIAEAVGAVFTTMLSAQVERLPEEGTGVNGAAQIAGSVGFVGQISGVVCVYTTEAHACRIARRFVGLQESSGRSVEMVTDAIGELTNMIGGHIKSCLADRGYPCRLSIPSIVRGSRFSIGSVTDTMRRTVHFRCEGEPLVVEVIVKRTL